MIKTSFAVCGFRVIVDGNENRASLIDVLDDFHMRRINDLVETDGDADGAGGLVLIAAAPDFTERMLLKGLSPEDRATLERDVRDRQLVPQQISDSGVNAVLLNRVTGGVFVGFAALMATAKN